MRKWGGGLTGLSERGGDGLILGNFKEKKGWREEGDRGNDSWKLVQRGREQFYHNNEKRKGRGGGGGGG